MGSYGQQKANCSGSADGGKCFVVVTAGSLLTAVDAYPSFVPGDCTIGVDLESIDPGVPNDAAVLWYVFGQD